MDIDAGIAQELAQARGIPPVLTSADFRCSHTLPEEEARIRWRLSWYRDLMAAGWQPPARVLAQVERDQLLLGLDAPDRFADGLGVQIAVGPASPHEENAAIRAYSIRAREQSQAQREQARQMRERARSRPAARGDRGAGDASRPLPAEPGPDTASAGETLQLRQALVSRAVIEQAKGMIMLRRQCSDDEAFRLLVAASQRSHRKLRDVAEMIVSWAAPGSGADRASPL